MIYAKYVKIWNISRNKFKKIIILIDFLSINIT